ncbi:MAG TPA: hypothetical protein ENN38_05785 [Actinobacteria bacterium]|nr:hypothetical protein [Actinomycetota bacterium]
MRVCLGEKKKNIKRMVARTLGLIWALWWFLFEFLSGIEESSGFFDTLVHIFVPGGLFLIIVFIAWRWEYIGGIVLITDGLFLAVGYPYVTWGKLPFLAIFLMLLTMALPPILSGILFTLSAKEESKSLSLSAKL